MKLTVRQLRKIIREQVESELFDLQVRRFHQEDLNEGWKDKLKNIFLGAAMLGTVAAGGKYMADQEMDRRGMEQAFRSKADKIGDKIQDLADHAKKGDEESLKALRELHKLAIGSRTGKTGDLRTLEKQLSTDVSDASDPFNMARSIRTEIEKSPNLLGQIASQLQLPE